MSNPPFVVGAPAGATRHTYRDGGLPLDGVSARLAGAAPDHLTDGGTLVLLANWVLRDGEPWDERVAGWLPSHGVDALAVQREVLDPAEYVATWLRDAGERGTPGYLERYDEWLAALEGDRVEGVGFGFVVVRRTGADPASRRWTGRTRSSSRSARTSTRGWTGSAGWRPTRPTTALAAATVTLAADVVQEQVGAARRRGPRARRAAPAGGPAAGLRQRHGDGCAGRRVRREASRGHTGGRGRARCWGRRRGRRRGTTSTATGTCWRRSGCWSRQAC